MESSLADFDYTEGASLEKVTVSWKVDVGKANYDNFKFNKCTPKTKRDPAKGSMSNPSQSGKKVTFDFKFTELHFAEEENVATGNAHFKLYLNVDTDGDKVVDSRAGFGVNLHVEDPQS